MRTIKIGFSTRKKALLARLIRKLEGTPFSHSYIKFNPRSVDVPMVYQASSLFLHFEAAVNFNDRNVVVFEKEIEVTEEQYYDILKYCMINAAKPYSIKQLFSILSQRIGQVFGIRIKNWAKNGESAQICSELVYRILEKVGYSLDKDPDIVTPKDLYELVKIDI